MQVAPYIFSTIVCACFPSEKRRQKRLRPPSTFSFPVVVQPNMTSQKDLGIYKSMANSGGKTAPVETVTKV